MTLAKTSMRFGRLAKMHNISIKLHESPSEKHTDRLKKCFNQYIEKQMPGLPAESEDRIFTLSAKDEKDTYIGGILANCYWDGLEIDTLWIDPSHRGCGLGARLLSQAEQYGKDNGAVIAFLRTVDAKRFYEKSGYCVYGVLEDRPIGSVLYHMKKRL